MNETKKQLCQYLECLLQMLFIFSLMHSGPIAPLGLRQVLSDYGVLFDKVASYGTDNASYMLPTLQRSKEILPNCFHMRLITQYFKLVVKEFMQSFAISIDWTSKIAANFRPSGARKQRYLTFLEQSATSGNCPQYLMPLDGQQCLMRSLFITLTFQLLKHCFYCWQPSWMKETRLPWS